jgi:hypothetical protein
MGVEPWRPELGANGRVEIFATFFDGGEGRSGRYVSESVTSERYAGLWDAKLLKFQMEGLPRPEGHPSREEVQALIDGELQPVSRNGSKFVRPTDPNKEARRDPPAYLLSPQLRQKLGIEASAEDGLDEEEPVRPLRPIIKSASAKSPKEDPWEIKRREIVARYRAAALDLRKAGRDPNAKALAAYMSLPIEQVENFMAFNPKFQEEGEAAFVSGRVQKPQIAPVSGQPPSLPKLKAEPDSIEEPSKRVSAEAKKIAFWWASGELWRASDKSKALSAKDLTKKALEYLATANIQEASLYVEFFTLFGGPERDELRFPAR